MAATGVDLMDMQVSTAGERAFHFKPKLNSKKQKKAS